MRDVPLCGTIRMSDLEAYSRCVPLWRTSMSIFLYYDSQVIIDIAKNNVFNAKR